MSFLYPKFLYLLVALIIPILIHLFDFKRPKKIFFSRIELLKEVQLKTKSQSKLRHLITLLLRCLAIASVIIAFAQPKLLEEKQELLNENDGVIIYIDNSFSMELKKGGISLLEIAKNRAIAIVEAQKSSERFKLLSNSSQKDPKVWLKREQLIERISQIEANGNVQSLGKIFERIKGINSNEEKESTIFVLSDFQRSGFDLDSKDQFSNLKLIPLEADESTNITIDSLALYSPFHLRGQSEKLKAFVSHSSDQEIENVSFQLHVNDQFKTPLSSDLSSGKLDEINFNFQNVDAKWQEGYVSIQDYPLSYDDTLFFNFSTKQSISIIHISNSSFNEHIKQIYTVDSVFNYQTQSLGSLDYELLKTADFILLEGINDPSSGFASLMNEYVKGGTCLGLIPPQEKAETLNNLLTELGVNTYKSLVKEESIIGDIDFQHFLFSGVFEEKPEQLKLPSLSSYYSLKKLEKTNRRDIFSLRNGNAFLSQYKVGAGNVFLFSASLAKENSAFTEHSLFVPIFYNMALLSNGQNPIYYMDGEKNAVLVDLEESMSDLPIRLQLGKVEVIPPQRRLFGSMKLNLEGFLEKAGHYKIWQGDKNIGVLSYNYNRDESQMKFLNKVEINDFLLEKNLSYDFIDEANGDSFKQVIQDQQNGHSIWKYFITLALLFLGLELLVIRFFNW